MLKYIIAAAGTTGLAKAPALAMRKRRLKQYLTSGSRNAFSRSANPRISFIIPVFNGAPHTLECLLSILRVADCSYEVIVVDDASHDETQTLLSRFENIHIHRNVQNLGFLRSVNVGAKLARGEYLALINNDARLVDGSLAAALQVYENENNCGLMGARVRHVSGGLQEAGCIIYQDGTTNGYLRYQREDDPRAMFQRDVDYCSGVFALIARSQFEALGGLDETYAPAYFEETDLSMRLREKRLRCIYNPRLLIDHFEFGSSANAIAARQMIEARRGLFVARWADTLRREKFFPSENLESVHSAALRLLPHPRELIIYDVRASVLPDLLGTNKSPGHLTIYFLHSTKRQRNELLLRAGADVQYAFGNTRQLKHFVFHRAGVYDTIETSVGVSAELVAQLHKIQHLCSTNQETEKGYNKLS